jgi:hypothetical protein
MLQMDFTSQDYLRDPATGLAKLISAAEWIETTGHEANRRKAGFGKLALHEEFPDACIEAIAPFLGEDAADH